MENDLQADTETLMQICTDTLVRNLMIVTGAPIETMAYEEVEYWPEIKEIFDWARTHVTSTL